MLSANQIAEFFEKYIKKEVNDEVYFWYVDKHRSFPQVDTISLSVSRQTCPKYPKEEVCISLQYLQKHLQEQVDFLPGEKHESILQIGCITLGVCSQGCPKYSKRKVCDIFAISQRNREE